MQHFHWNRWRKCPDGDWWLSLTEQSRDTQRQRGAQWFLKANNTLWKWLVRWFLVHRGERHINSPFTPFAASVKWGSEVAWGGYNTCEAEAEASIRDRLGVEHQRKSCTSSLVMQTVLWDLDFGCVFTSTKNKYGPIAQSSQRQNIKGISKTLLDSLNTIY